ncbi:hypothetical protein ACOME3_004604 [Neoechinorhynchus agilis]
MQHVDEFFSLHQVFMEPIKNSKRTVYIMSDDPKVLENSNADSYNFVFDVEAAKTGQSPEIRYNTKALDALVVDITIMAECDYLVCTFSSQICRLIYELMLFNRRDEDASWRFTSLDDIYYYGGQNPHHVKARFIHEAVTDSEIDIEVGDMIGLAGNHWNGYSVGTNTRTQLVGLFPSYKCDEIVRIVIANQTISGVL